MAPFLFAPFRRVSRPRSSIAVLVSAALVVALGPAPASAAPIPRQPNDGGAVFREPVRVPLGTGYAYGVTLGDLDGNGIPDLIGTDPGANAVIVRLGLGLGAFGPEASFPTGSPSQAVAAGDVNGDGHADVVTANLDGTASVLLGTGSGGLLAPYVFPTAAHAYGSLQIADIDADGNVDLLFGVRDIGIAPGAGGGAFSSYIPIGSSTDVTGVAAANLDLDPALEVMLAIRWTCGEQSGGGCSVPIPGRVSVMNLSGAWTFDGSTQMGEFDDASGYNGVAAMDADGDGDLDIVAVGGPLVTFLNTGDGAFPTHAVSSSGGVQVLLTGDVSLDGHDDVVGLNPGAVSTLLGDGLGRFHLNSTVGSGVGISPAGAIGDMDGDGYLDVVENAYPAGGVSLYFNQGKEIPVATRVSLVSREVNGGRVHVAWHGTLASGQPVSIERRVPEGPWITIAAANVSADGLIEHEDSGLSPGRYGYRLVARATASAPEWASQEAWVEVATSPLRVWIDPSNPARGAVRASIQLPLDSPARVEMVDVSGRVLVRRTIQGEGRHTVELVNAGDLAAGVYWVRALQGGASHTARVSVMR